MTTPAASPPKMSPASSPMRSPPSPEESAKESSGSDLTPIEERMENPDSHLRRAGRLATDDVRLVEKVQEFSAKEDAKAGKEEEIVIARFNEAGAASQLLMGKSYRNPITGQVRFSQCFEVKDFAFVDLFMRHFLKGPLDELVKDVYLFKAIPLLHRTWFYHRLYHSGKLVTVGMEVVLEERMIDAIVDAGQWSPVMANVVGLIGTVLMRDRLLVFVAVVSMLFTLACTVVLEDPTNYHQVRPLTFPVRIACLGVGLWRFASRVDILSLLGFAIFFLACAVDHAWGDGRMVAMLGAYCHYEIKREVSKNQLYICERKGASFYDEAFDVSFNVTGLALWPSNMVLIAEVNGLLAELKPISRQEWELMAQHYYRDNDKDQVLLHFYGMDIYDDDMPTWEAMFVDDEEDVMFVGQDATELD